MQDPSPKQLLTRLEKDIAWLEIRGLWSRDLFEKAVLRYVEARGSTRGLEDFTRRHRIRKGLTESWIPGVRDAG